MEWATDYMEPVRKPPALDSAILICRANMAILKQVLTKITETGVNYIIRDEYTDCMTFWISIQSGFRHFQPPGRVDAIFEVLRWHLTLKVWTNYRKRVAMTNGSRQRHA